MTLVNFIISFNSSFHCMLIEGNVVIKHYMNTENYYNV